MSLNPGCLKLRVDDVEVEMAKGDGQEHRWVFGEALAEGLVRDPREGVVLERVPDAGHERAARLQDAPDLAVGLVTVWKEHHAECRCDRVERPVFEGKIARVRLAGREPRVADCGFRELDHWCLQIGRDQRRVGRKTLQEVAGRDAGSAGRFEDRAAGGDGSARSELSRVVLEDHRNEVAVVVLRDRAAKGVIGAHRCSCLLRGRARKARWPSRG